jgi:hypothetical protein
MTSSTTADLVGCGISDPLVIADGSVVPNHSVETIQRITRWRRSPREGDPGTISGG